MASFNLAREYLSNKEIQPDYNRAFKLMESASSHNITYAQLWLSQLYGNGFGVEKNLTKSKVLLDEAKRSASPKAINSFAWELVTDGNKQLHNGVTAVDLMEDLLINKRNETPERLDTLAAAYAEVGEFERAIQTQQGALGRLPKDFPDDKRHPFVDRLKRYESHKKLGD